MTTITDPSDGHPVVLSDRTTGIDLPRTKGQEITFMAHGARFHLKKVTGTEFFLSCPLVSPRARFGDRKQIREDVAYCQETGKLPPRSPNSFA